MGLKQDMHDRLWRAFQRWEALRLTGATKHELKMRGIRECGDPNRHTRSLIFTGNTLRTYEAPLKDFIEMAQRDFGATRLEDLGKREFRAFMDRAIERGLAVKTLNMYRSALAKFGALTGQSQSFAALSEKYGWKIRGLAKAGQLPSPTRATPGSFVVARAIEILRQWDARHFARTGEPRAYNLAARVQLETAARSISATARLTPDSLHPDGMLILVGKGGKELSATLSAELHRLLSHWFQDNPGPLASQAGYRSAYARAMEAAGGRVQGTHGLRRRSTRNLYSSIYSQAASSGMAPSAAAEKAASDSIHALGHSRHRRDLRGLYLGW
jgi:hypothetical protein